MGMEETLALETERHRRFPPGPRAAPWLVYPHGNYGKDQAFCNLCDPNITYLRSIPEISYKRYWQSPSHQGWLVVLCEFESSKRGDCFLWDPVSFETIHLPTLLQWVDNSSLDYYDCLLSSAPSNPNSMVLFLFNTALLVFCHPGDEQWRTLDLSIENDSTGQIFCFKGSVYYIYPNNDELMIKELVVANDQSLSIKTLNGSFETPPLPPVVGAVNEVRTYYVESLDDLFMVEKHYNADKLVTLQVLRMDFSLMTWEEVKSLEDHVLFLGQFTTASCSAADLGYTSGCVYFIESDDKSLYTFDLEDGSISVALPCLNLPTSWLTPEWVIMPMTSRVTDGRRRTEHLDKRRRINNVIMVEEENKPIINDYEGQTNNGGELELARNWGNLNAVCKVCRGELELGGTWGILNAVCKACRLAIPEEKWRTSCIERKRDTSLSPWLVFLKSDDAIYNFLDPMHNEKHIVNHSEFKLLVCAKIHFSKGGWLLMSKGQETFFFYNPFTRVLIKLPELPDELNYMVSGICFSSLPTSSDCKIFAIGPCFGCCDHKVHIFFIARGDNCWKEHTLRSSKVPKEERKEFKPCLNNPVYYAEDRSEKVDHARAFFCLDSNGSLGVFDFEDNYGWTIIAKPEELSSSIDRSFLVECSGELLSVFLGHQGKWVRIFRRDFVKSIWVEVQSLGKYMLFVSRSSCISVVAQDSRMANKIYFPRFQGEEIIFYSLHTGKYHSLGSRHSALDFYNTKEQIHCSWIEPNWSQPTDEEMDWLCI